MYFDVLSNLPVHLLGAHGNTSHVPNLLAINYSLVQRG